MGILTFLKKMGKNLLASKTNNPILEVGHG